VDGACVIGIIPKDVYFCKSEKGWVSPELAHRLKVLILKGQAFLFRFAKEAANGTSPVTITEIILSTVTKDIPFDA